MRVFSHPLLHFRGRFRVLFLSHLALSVSGAVMGGADESRGPLVLDLPAGSGRDDPGVRVVVAGTYSPSAGQRDGTWSGRGPRPGLDHRPGRTPHDLPERTGR